MRVQYSFVRSSTSRPRPAVPALSCSCSSGSSAPPPPTLPGRSIIGSTPPAPRHAQAQAVRPPPPRPHPAWPIELGRAAATCRKEGGIYGHEAQRVDGATVYGHTTPTRPTPSYLRDYHNDNRGKHGTFDVHFLGGVESSPVHRAFVLVLGANIAVLLGCSKSSIDSVAFLTYLLTYF